MLSTLVSWLHALDWDHEIPAGPPSLNVRDNGG